MYKIKSLVVLLALIQLIPMVHEADLVTVLVQAVPDNLTGLVLSVIADLYSGSPIALASFSAAAAAFFHLMHRLSDMTQRLLLVKVLALVRPSPVLLAMVKVQ